MSNAAAVTRMAAQFLGNTDEVTTCECCGRADLKGTVALSFDGAAPVYYGVVCAARALSVSATVVRQRARSADEERAQRESVERSKAHAAEFARWSEWLTRNAPGGTCVFTRIQSLGGIKTARGLYLEQLEVGA